MEVNGGVGQIRREVEVDGRDTRVNDVDRLRGFGVLNPCSLTCSDRDTIEDVGDVVLLDNELSVPVLFEGRPEEEVIYRIEETRSDGRRSSRRCHNHDETSYTKESAEYRGSRVRVKQEANLGTGWSSQSKGDMACGRTVCCIEGRGEGSESCRCRLTGCHEETIQLSDERVGRVVAGSESDVHCLPRRIQRILEINGEDIEIVRSGQLIEGEGNRNRGDAHDELSVLAQRHDGLSEGNLIVGILPTTPLTAVYVERVTDDLVAVSPIAPVHCRSLFV